jgi:hypothetical protein
MYVFALRNIVDLPLLERRVSVHARNALPALEATVTDWSLVPTRNL